MHRNYTSDCVRHVATIFSDHNNSSHYMRIGSNVWGLSLVYMQNTYKWLRKKNMSFEHRTQPSVTLNVNASTHVCTLLSLLLSSPFPTWKESVGEGLSLRGPVCLQAAKSVCIGFKSLAPQATLGLSFSLTYIWLGILLWSTTWIFSITYLI